jgi:uncharacterized DUF497 family protein
VATVVRGDFEWDDEKAAENLRKHGVTFETAAIAVTDPFAIDFEDAMFPDRLATLASAGDSAILYVVTTDQESRIRIISARRATSHE